VKAGNIVYVSSIDNGGSDTSGNGSVNRPWASIKFTLEQLSGCAAELNPIEIQLGAGTFQEAVTLIPFVSIKGVNPEDNGATIIAPTPEQTLANRSDGQPTAVIAANQTAMSDLSIQLPTTTGDGWRVLAISDVEMDVANVDFGGRNIQGSVGIVLSGLGTSASEISNCSIHNVEFGIRALETNATIRGSRFESIEEDAIFVVEPTSRKGAAATAVPDMGDVVVGDDTGSGGNTFLGGDSIGGNFINNRNTIQIVSAEGNNFGTDDFDEIKMKVVGSVDFEPRLATANLSLVFTLTVGLRDSDTSSGISGGSVTVDPPNGLPTEVAGANYVFQALPFEAYKVSATAVNYTAAIRSLDDPDINIPLLISMDSTLPTTSEAATSLSASFGSLDSDNSGGLSFEEARARIPMLTQSQFNEIDSNRDESLSETELTIFLNPSSPGGCPPSKAALKRYLGDFFLLGLAMVGLVAWRKHL
tara:strand:- start:1068 stop:2489 length:1422 start_codon:yes stop_codon:yes gene_type:complete